MAKPLVTDELWQMIEPLLPAEAEKPKGGRPRVSARFRSGGVERHFVCLENRDTLGDVAAVNGVWQRHDLLAALAGLADRRGLGEIASDFVGASV